MVSPALSYGDLFDILSSENTKIDLSLSTGHLSNQCISLQASNTVQLVESLM